MRWRLLVDVALFITSLTYVGAYFREHGISSIFPYPEERYTCLCDLGVNLFLGTSHCDLFTINILITSLTRVNTGFRQVE